MLYTGSFLYFANPLLTLFMACFCLVLNPNLTILHFLIKFLFSTTFGVNATFFEIRSTMKNFFSIILYGRDSERGRPSEKNDSAVSS